MEAGKEAARQAGPPHYRAAGEKLLEAKAQLPYGEFQQWCRGNFGFGGRTARRYMKLARATSDIENGTAVPFSSLRDFDQQTSAPRERLKINFNFIQREEGKNREERTMVPSFVITGTKIVVMTADGNYVERAKD